MCYGDKQRRKGGSGVEGVDREGLTENWNENVNEVGG